MLIEGMVSIEELALVQKKGIESSHEEQNSLNSRRHTCTITAAAGRRRGGGGCWEGRGKRTLISCSP